MFVIHALHRSRVAIDSCMSDSLENRHLESGPDRPLFQELVDLMKLCLAMIQIHFGRAIGDPTYMSRW